MKIEQEIQQETFRNEYQKVTINLLFSSNWVLEQIRLLLEKEDITPQQYNILRIVKGSSQPLSTLQIRERMIDKMSDTSRIVERLMKKGLLNKITCSHDKRLVEISLTGKGMELLERLTVNNTQLDAITGNLSPEEAKTLNSLLDKMRGGDR
ncbi:MarR family transcriptional regulator [Segetibacter sp. 3557_3]|uniref:MarR family winged helix-turn-helix transcriptional regulator n=1 Tax=Segetibacter sp. 3557_3 TaxID=2547429 RepID=UPI001058B21C|nr:winged helix DNA-binding protein [Segetibacter sp. 3557_3]TDH18336.1 MarR family transcriptional regulator [Segetibacter sp. 3557_3]